MLTIKHVWPRGFETIYPALQVRASIPGINETCSNELPFVAFDKPDGEVWTIRDGVVYVMNDTGKTIQSYHLSSLDSVSPPSQTTPHGTYERKTHHG